MKYLIMLRPIYQRKISNYFFHLFYIIYNKILNKKITNIKKLDTKFFISFLIN